MYEYHDIGKYKNNKYIIPNLLNSILVNLRLLTL